MSDTPHSSPMDLAAAYALGALDADDARTFEAYLASSPEAQREVAAFREVAALLAAGADAPAPGAELRARVLRSRPGTAAPQAASRVSAAARPRRSPWAVAVLASGMAAALFLAFALGRSRDTLRQELAARDSTLGELAARLRGREATLNAILEPGVRIYELTSSGDPKPGAQLFVDRARGVAILHAFRLKQAPAGRAYQLWFIKDGKPVPSLTFNADTTGHAMLQQVPFPAGGVISAAAVTEEPATGSLQPTTPILLVAPLPAS